MTDFSKNTIDRALVCNALPGYIEYRPPRFAGVDP